MKNKSPGYHSPFQIAILEFGKKFQIHLLVFILLSLSAAPKVEAARQADLTLTQVALTNSTVTFKIQVGALSGTPANFDLNANSTLEIAFSATSILTGWVSANLLGNFTNGSYTISGGNYNSSTGIVTFGINFSGTAVNVNGLEDFAEFTLTHNGTVGTTNATWGVDGTNIGGRSDGNFTNLSNVPLPVTFTKFKGELLDDKVILFWATAMEINNEKFEIERSTNGIDFIKVDEVNGIGNSNQLTSYSYIDNNIVQLSSHFLFYRLKQVDYDGQFKYSNITIIKKSEPIDNIGIYPNPAYTTLTIELNDPELSNISMEIIGLDGKLYMKNSMDLESNYDISNLVDGIYYIKIIANDSSQILDVQKLIKQ